MKNQTRKYYSLDFKVQAVERYLANNCNLKTTAGQLNVHPATMKHWVNKGIDSLRSQLANKSSSADAEVKKLKKEVARLTEENDILKKAARMFAAQS